MGSLDEDPVFELVEEPGQASTEQREESEDDLDAQDGSDRAE